MVATGCAAAARAVDDLRDRRERAAAIFREHGAYVASCLLGLGVRASHVDDAVQEVFVVVYRRVHEIDVDCRVKVWLFAISRRVASHFRREAQRVERKLLALSAGPPPQVRDPEHSAVQSEAFELVERFLGSLDEERRLVFYLVGIEQMTAPEIATAHGIKLNTVYSRLRLARRQLEQALAASCEPAMAACG